jgi:ring-1,2-phenylacetyl-CoA epoxidase subunit PaaC
MSMTQQGVLEDAGALTEAARSDLRDLLLVLSDSKRLLGTRYAGWILGAPELEAGIASASMAQDEWGHGRLLYSVLKDFGADVDVLEHGREAAEYCSMEVLDRAPQSWAEVVVLQAFADAALTLQLEALRESSYTPVRQRIEKLLDEEVFHAAHGRAWFRRMAGANAAAAAELQAAVRWVLPSLLTWFGPDSERARRLQEEHVTSSLPGELRARFLEQVAPLLALVGEEAAASMAVNYDGFDEACRRTDRTGPDAETIAKVRGDKNRVFLMD